VISSDVVRKELAEVPAEEHRYEMYEGGIYAPDVTERTYAGLLARAREALTAGRSVVLDATFIRRGHRRAAAKLAKETGAQFACVWVTASSAETRRRIERRIAEGRDVSDAGWAVYLAQKRRVQRPSEVAPERLIEVNSARPIETQLKLVTERLRSLSPLSLAAG
jgi:predicted kinase